MSNEYYSRVFLNPENWKHSIAAVYGLIDIDNDHGYLDLDAELTISDCNRNITLDFNVFGRDNDEMLDDIDQYREKVKTLRTEINHFLDALDEAYDTVEAKVLERLAKEKMAKAEKAEKEFKGED